MRFETDLIHGGKTTDPLTKAVNIPIYQTSTYRQSELFGQVEYEYSRTKNPTRTAVETLVAQLEGGVAGFAFASGMAALSTVLSLFKQGDHLIISDNLYGGSYRVLDKVFTNFGLSYTMVDTSNLHAVETAMQQGGVAILVESPTNPLLVLSDIQAISALAKQYHFYHIVDNTFMTPFYQKPLQLGADIVVHSGTKYLGGHSDLIAGVVVVKDENLAQRIGFLQNAIGAVLGPMDSFLLVRGIKTLALRMERHQANAIELVARLVKHQDVARVFHPSLPEHRQHTLALQQASGHVSLIAFELQPHINLHQFFKSLNTITFAESLGGVESLICHPASMTHASYPENIRHKVGITDHLIRLSAGIEHIEDLWVDLTQAIAASKL